MSNASDAANGSQLSSMRCHYEVLAVERDAAAGDIKKAFHRQALKWHPDKHQKNGISSEEATQRFQEIQNAYEVLSDPHERKWYDEHREQILRGDDGDADGESENDINLFRFFSASVYAGFGDDEKGFYAVYSALFEKIDALDLESVGSGARRAPVLGTSQTPIDEVNEFYRHWTSYVTQRSFAWVDEYKTTDAPTRQIRRAMEKENKKLRDVAKKAFTTDVRELVEFVRKRDPRMVAYLKKKEKEREQQVQLEEQRKREKQAAFEAQRLAFQQQELERWDNDEHETSRLAEDHIQEEIEKLRRKMDAELLLCEICNKTFKSDKQLQNHLTSKKHKDREIELGIVSEFDLVEDALDKELQAEIEEMKRAKKAQEATQHSEGCEETANRAPDQQDDDVVTARAEAEEAARREKERIRREKEEKAAEKRRERKDARKTKKKEEVEKIVSAAKKKEIEEDDEEGRRGKGTRGKKKK